jgi:hypothetical protein
MEEILMTLCVRKVAAGLVLLVAALSCGGASAQELSMPAPGDRVVVYTHKFNPQDFEAGKELVIEGFGEAMTKHGDDRLTFFLVDEAASDVVVVSLFVNGSSVERWHDAMVRHEVLDKLAGLRRQPLILQEFDLEGIHVVE